MKIMEEKNLNVILQIPFIIYSTFSIFIILIPGLGNLNITIAIMSISLLFLNGYGLSKNKKIWNIISFISITIFTIWYGIMGYYDDIKWTSSKIAIILLIFYVVVFIVKRKNIRKF